MNICSGREAQDIAAVLVDSLAGTWTDRQIERGRESPALPDVTDRQDLVILI
jgi:hypothetical protein